MWPVTTRDLLEELAQRHGVATSYTSQSGFPVHVAEDTIAYTLRALGVAIDTITEKHGGPFAGHHARYVLASHVAAGREGGAA